jgi:hypothetical protein
VTRIVAHEHFIDLENRSQLSVECFRRDVSQVEEDLVLAADTLSFDTYLEDFTSSNVTRDEVAVGRILLLEEVETLFFRNRRRLPGISLMSRHPNASTFTSR